MTSPLPPPVRQPAGESERVQGLDVVRGFAILGLTFVNLPAMASADFYRRIFFQMPPEALAEGLLRFAIEFFLAGKCVALLAFLLGAGLALQQQRTEATGGSFPALVWRRMGVLVVVGLLHMVFLWCGDILAVYGLMGLTLLLFHRSSPTTRRVVAAACMVLSVLLLLPTAFLAEPLPPTPRIAPGESVDFWNEAEEDTFDRTVEYYLQKMESVYQTGSYLAILGARLIESAVTQLTLLVFFPFYFAVVLLGYDAIRSRWFPWSGHLPRGRWIGPLLAACLALSFASAGMGAFFPASLLCTLLYEVSIPASLGMAALYLCFLVKNPAGRLAEKLALVGRSALSNYLLQSLVAALVFQGWGLGWYGRLSFPQVILLAAGLTVGQLLWTPWWLKRFRFGPMEYLWRSLVYGPQTGTLRGAHPNPPPVQR